MVNAPKPLCTLVFTFLNHFKWSRVAPGEVSVGYREEFPHRGRPSAGTGCPGRWCSPRPWGVLIRNPALQGCLHCTSTLTGFNGVRDHSPCNFWVWPPSLMPSCLLSWNSRHLRLLCEQGSSSHGRLGSPALERADFHELLKDSSKRVGSENSIYFERSSV